MIKFSCPHCNQHLEAEDETAGTALPCPACQQDIRVPPANAIRIASAPSTPKWRFRLNGTQLKLMWAGVALLSFFGVFQMQIDGGFTVYDESARSVGLYQSGYGFLPGSFSKPKPLIETPKIKFTPILDEFRDGTITILVFTLVNVLVFMLLWSDLARRHLNRAQSKVLLIAVILFDLILTHPIDTAGSQIKFAVYPMLSTYYHMPDYAAYFTISAIIITLLAGASVLTIGLNRKSEEQPAEQSPPPYR